MATKELMRKLSVYIPQSKLEKKPVERLMALGAKRDRSVNYLVCESIIEYLDREEAKK